MVLGKVDSYMHKIKLDSFPIPSTKINSEWIKYFNARPEAMKLLEEYMGSMLFDMSLSSIFLDLSPQAREKKGK